MTSIIGRSAPRRAPRSAARSRPFARCRGLPLGISLVLFCACASPAPEPVASAPEPTVSWRSMPLSWAKLDTLEDYLDSQAARADPASRLEAELELSEGRLTFARRERAHTSPQRTALRLARAEAGFEVVLADRFATSAQRRRARRGLDDVEAERGATGTSVPLPGGGIVTRLAWGALPADPGRLTPHRGTWSRITVHHSADQNAIAGIQRYHMRTNDWGDIGYHFLVDSAGRVYEGRSLAWRGAHAGNASSNQGNLGICVLGDYSTGRPGAAALRSLEALVTALARAHGIPDARIIPHGDLKATDCPGPYLTSWTHNFRKGSRTAAVTAGTAAATGAAAPASPAPAPRAERYRNSGTVR